MRDEKILRQEETEAAQAENPLSRPKSFLILDPKDRHGFLSLKFPRAALGEEDAWSPCF